MKKTGFITSFLFCVFAYFFASQKIKAQFMTACSPGLSETSFSTLGSKHDLKSMFTLVKPIGPADDNQKYGAGPISALVKSLIIPGWGLYSASGHAYYLGFAPVAWGFVAWGFVEKSNSEKTYQQYLDCKVQKDMDPLYQTANEQRQAYLNRVEVGVFVYVLQAGMSFVWGRYNQIYRQRAANWKKNLSINIMPNYNPTIAAYTMNTNVSFKFFKKKKIFTDPFLNNNIQTGNENKINPN